MRIERIKLSSRRSRIAMYALTAVALLFSRAYAAADHVETVVREIELDGAKSILVQGIVGNIEVSGEKDRGSIYLKVVKNVTAENEDEARKLAAMMEIDVSRAGSVLKIEMQYPKNYKVKKNIFSFIIDRNSKMNAEMTLVVPEELGLAVSLSTGTIRVYDMAAPMTATISTGTLDIRNIKWDVVVSHTTGKDEIAEISGDTRVSMTSGSVSCRNLSGSAEVSMTTGSLDLSSVEGGVSIEMGYGTVGVRGSINASTASVSLNFRTSPENDVDYRITSSSGSITLRFLNVMPGGFYLVASTTSGDIDAVLPIDITKVGRTHIVGRVREGKAKVFLETASGDITIEEPEE
jgi:DUF4097 and DUF4098 domain-containing protein YvlB